MNHSPGGASNQQSFLTTKVKIFSLIVTVIGFLTLVLEFFPCQLVDWSSQWNLHFLLFYGIFYLFFLTLFLWPIWWSIYSNNLNSSQKITSAINISFYWAIALFCPWLILGIIGGFFAKTYTLLRSGAALIALNFSFLKAIKARERKAALIPWGISLAICLAIFFSETPYITPINFNSKLTDFEAVVALVDSGKLVPDVYGSVELPCKYSYLADRGNKFNKGSIKITKEGEGKIIQFRQRTYGFGDGADFFIYRSDNKDISQFRPEDSYGTGVVKLKDHWFWQTIRS
ncbi:MAG: hypothetical protein AB1861_23825 [Cyanobacteriota bacterium]